MDFNYLVSEIKNYYREFEYDKLIVDYIFTLEGSYNFIVKYEKNTKSKESEVSNKPIRSTVRKMAEIFEEEKNSSKKFNRVKIEINLDSTYSEKYWWDTEKEKQDLLNYADIFYQWVNERMISMIFEYEKDNNLVPTQYDSDGDLEYLSSWEHICKGGKEGGSIGLLPISSRFRWLTATRSTIVQTSKTHPGFCDNASETLECLFRELVL